MTSLSLSLSLFPKKLLSVLSLCLCLSRCLFASLRVYVSYVPYELVVNRREEKRSEEKKSGDGITEQKTMTSFDLLIKYTIY